ncbi:MAG: DUF6580 family putative transport protein [Candidatus Paceibacterota bacterium]|jgi:hypothetical protein
MTQEKKIQIALVLIIIGVLGRFLPHAWNFAPVVAIGIFSGAYLGGRFAFAVPVATMIASDLFIGFYDWQINLTVYAAMGLAGMMGILLKGKKSPLGVVLASIGGSTIFFLLSNAAVWIFGTMYSHSWHGLVESYIAGIPFFKNALAGDVIYTGAFFGAFEYLRHRVPAVSRMFSPIKVR